jgi:hypothetical protein
MAGFKDLQRPLGATAPPKSKSSLLGAARVLQRGASTGCCSMAYTSQYADTPYGDGVPSITRTTSLAGMFMSWTSRKVHSVEVKPMSPPASPSRVRQAAASIIPSKEIQEQIQAFKAHPLRFMGRRLLLTSLIGPEVLWKRIWDWIILLLVVYNAIKIPLDISFETGRALEAFDYAVDAVFALDIYLTFRQSFLDPLGSNVRDNRVIAQRYLSSWFLIDFAAAIPTDLLLLNTTKDRKQLLLLKLPRLLRIGRLMKKMEQIQATSHPIPICLPLWQLSERGTQQWHEEGTGRIRMSIRGMGYDHADWIR